MKEPAAEGCAARERSIPTCCNWWGGPPRTGKSALALALLRRHGVPWLSTDVLRTVLRWVVPRIDEVDGGLGHIDELVQAMRPFIDQTIEVCLGQSHDYLIEGVEILPADVTRYKARFGETRSCFLGDSTVSASDLRAYRGENPWHAAHAESELERMATDIRETDIREWSALTAEECQRHGRDYVDIGRTGFETGIERGMAFLLGSG